MRRWGRSRSCNDHSDKLSEAIAQGNALLEASSLEVQRWWQQLFAADSVLANEAVAES
jgi:hypothetical protein